MLFEATGLEDITAAATTPRVEKLECLLLVLRLYI